MELLQKAQAPHDKHIGLHRSNILSTAVANQRLQTVVVVDVQDLAINIVTWSEIVVKRTMGKLSS